MYVGEWLDGCRHGQGKLTNNTPLPNRGNLEGLIVYEGTWAGDVKEVRAMSRIVVCGTVPTLTCYVLAG